MSVRRPLALLAPLAALSLAGCGINTIPAAQENAKAKWADVQNQYQRRADLIPNLVATVKGFAAQEKSVLIGVTQARQQAVTVNVTGDDLTNPDKVHAYEAAQGHLTQQLGQLMTRLQENYPQLTSQENFMALQSQIEGTENRISVARSDYNQAVQQYNTTIRTFPDSVGAKVIYGAKPMQPFAATTPNAQTAPSVSF